MEKQLTVAIYSGSIPAPVFIENLIQALADQGVQVYLYGRKTSPVYYTSNNIHMFPTPNHWFLLVGFILWQMIFLMIATPRKFYRLVTNYRKILKNNSGGLLNWLGKVLPVVNHPPDIFHIQWAKALPNWFFLKDLFEKKMVVSLRGAHINYSPLADENLSGHYRSLFPRVDRFHAVSQEIANEAKKYEAMAENIDVVYSPVNIESLQLYKKTNWETHSPFRFISVGRHHWKKGYHYTLSAVSQLVSNGEPVHYTIIAPDQPTEEILYQIDDLHLEAYVTMSSLDTQEEVYQKMNSADCLILSSVEEGIANVVMEAMAIGLPVISSDCGGMTEVIANGINGMIFPMRDIQALTLQMKAIMDMPILETELLVQNALKTVMKNHNSKLIGEKIFYLYEKVIA